MSVLSGKLESLVFVVATFGIVLTFGLFAALVGGWLLMLTLGILYAEFGLLAPVGYWVSVGLYYLLFALIAGFKASGNINSK